MKTKCEAAFVASLAKRSRFISDLGEPANLKRRGPILRVGLPLMAAGGLTSTDFEDPRKTKCGEMFDLLSTKK